MNYALPYIYTTVFTTGVNLFFNPLGCLLLRLYTNYILTTVLAFCLRFSYKTRVFYMRYLSSSY